ncbi:hypothetical protein [Mycobacterium sp. IDR2000157661]|uniref:hypothetical protein n=1 Tax=Mycobacterium sp. IDR2000157661 TaxID=2867005 RepID=UPI001EEEC115|nr:hypothetical protein [Mycobacterium sp. IDR2000157661]ULE35301.1 hypothetical protein K3G64_12495 [Mycobacterium sp. IDR2000157661]
MRMQYLGIGAVVSAAAAMALLGTATAAANDYVGQTFEDASEAMDEDGVDPIVATVVGDQLPEDDCIVTNAFDAPFLRGVGDDFEYSEDEVLVSLNCAGAYATATNPGTSVAHPLGREAKSEAEEEAAEAEEQELAEAETPDE